MLGVAQYRDTYHYLNWIPSESGPLVTHFGSYQLDVAGLSSSKNPFTSLFQSLFSRVNNGDPICTLSLELKNLYLSTCRVTEDSDGLLQWHLRQTQDNAMKEMLDFYHYPMSPTTGKMLNIAIPREIRNNIRDSMVEINAEMNALGLGIFSAEEGARQWFHAHKLKKYLIWKFGRKKNDELLLIEDGSLTAVFSISRTGNKVKSNWQFGHIKRSSELIEEIRQVLSGDSSSFNTVEQVFIYCSDGNFKDVKTLHELEINNLSLLNPLTVLETTVAEKFHLYKTLPLAETGISFRGIDV